MLIGFFFAALQCIDVSAGTNTARVAACQLQARVIDFRLKPDAVLEQVELNLAELEKIVAHLERGDVPLADSIRIYKRGAALKARCEGQLKDAQLEVDQIVMGPDGPRTEPAKLGQ